MQVCLFLRHAEKRHNKAQTQARASSTRIWESDRKHTTVCVPSQPLTLVAVLGTAYVDLNTGMIPIGPMATEFSPRSRMGSHRVSPVTEAEYTVLLGGDKRGLGITMASECVRMMCRPDRCVRVLGVTMKVIIARHL